MGFISLVTGMKGPSGFGSTSTAEEVTEGIDARNITAIVTGGASGIGEETVRVLSLRGAHVIIAARNMEAAERTRQSILKSNPSARLDILKIDLSSIKSVRAFAENFIAMDLPLNLLMYYVLPIHTLRRWNRDVICHKSYSTHFMAWSCVGHFPLTNLLLEKMKTTAKETGIEGRIVNVSSLMHRAPYLGGIRFDSLNENSWYIDKLAYGQSKLANILHANELSRRLQEEGVNITVNSAHPGVIMTNLMRYSSLLMNVAYYFTLPIWKSIPQGAATTCYVSLHPKVHGVTGKYFADCNETEASRRARDESQAKRLWDFSEKLIRIS